HGENALAQHFFHALEIEARRVLEEAGELGPVRFAGDAQGYRRDVALVDDRLAGDVEADRNDRRSAYAAEGAKDDPRRLRIVPDIEFRRGRDISRIGISAAHDDEPLDEARQFGLAHHGERDI